MTSKTDRLIEDLHTAPAPAGLGVDTAQILQQGRAARRRKTGTRIATALPLVAAATALVLFLTTTNTPSSPETDIVPADAKVVLGGDDVTTFVFQPKGSAEWRDFSQGGGRPEGARPVNPQELDEMRWELDGVLIGSVVTWPEEPMPGVPDEVFGSELIFSAQQQRLPSLAVFLRPCGEVMRLEPFDIGPDGALSGTSNMTAPDCSAAAAVNFWQDSLERASLHDDEGVIYLSVPD